MRHNLCIFDATLAAQALASAESLLRVCVTEGQVHGKNHGNTLTELGARHHNKGVAHLLEQVKQDDALHQLTNTQLGR